MKQRSIGSLVCGVLFAVSIVICIRGGIYVYNSPYFNLPFDDVYGSEDDRYFRVDGSVVVLPTILDYQFLGEYVVGIRMPANEVSCGRYKKMIVDHENIYFVLNVNTWENVEFLSKVEFEAYVFSKVGLVADLDYRKFYSSWEYFSGIYEQFSIFEKCVIQ